MTETPFIPSIGNEGFEQLFCRIEVRLPEGGAEAVEEGEAEEEGEAAWDNRLEGNFGESFSTREDSPGIVEKGKQMS